MRETVEWTTLEERKPEHEQLCVVCSVRFGMVSEPRVLRFNDDETGTYWYDPTLTLVWSIAVQETDHWAEAPVAPHRAFQAEMAAAS